MGINSEVGFLVVVKKKLGAPLVIILCVFAVLSLALPQSANAEPVYFDVPQEDGALVGGMTELFQPMMSSASMSTLNSSSSTVLDNGRSSNRVDLVFLGDGFTESQQFTYQSKVSAFLSYLLTEHPLEEFSPYFNAHRIDIISTQSGVDNQSYFGERRDTELDMEFWCQGVQSTLCIDVAKAWQFAAMAPDVDQIIALANAPLSGGSAYPFSDLSLISSGNAQSYENLLHQFAHSFANLADEYSQSGWPSYTGFEPAEANVSANDSEGMNSQRIKWYRWLGHNPGEAFGGLIGSFEGAMGHSQGIWRPTLNSKMRTLGMGFNSPSIESFVAEIYRKVDPIDEATPSQSGLSGADTLYVIPMEPLGRDLPIQWYINGAAIPSAVSREFRADDYPLADGTYTVSVKVHDDTPLVRNEELREQLMSSERSWQVEVDQYLPVIIDDIEDQSVRVGQSATFSLTASGGGLSYRWFRNGVLLDGVEGSTYTTPEATHADDGTRYWVEISNLNGTTETRHAVLNVLNYAPTLEPLVNRQAGWREVISVELFAADRDNDPLTFSAVAQQVDGNPVPSIEFSFEGSTMELRSKDGFSGDFRVLVSVTDSYDTTSTSFDASLTNRAPLLNAIPTQEFHWRTPSGSLTLSGVDPDGDPLSYTVEFVNTPPEGASVSNVGPEVSIQGPMAVTNLLLRASVTDGSSVTSRNFYVNQRNRAPGIASISNKSMHWRDDTLEFSVPIGDNDGDPLVLRAELDGNQDVPVSFRSDDNLLIIDPEPGYLGTFRVKAIVSDSIEEDFSTFLVSVTNNAPELPDVEHIETNWREIPGDFPLQASDPDGDPLSYSFETFYYEFPGELADTYQFEQMASSWRRNSSGNQEILIEGLAAESSETRAYALVGGKLYQWDSSIESSTEIAQLPGTFQNDPNLLLNPLDSIDSLPISFSVSGEQLLVEKTRAFSGSVGVRVTVSDSVESVSKEFFFTAWNERPLLSAVNGIELNDYLSSTPESIHWRTDEKEMEISSRDRDGRFDEREPDAALEFYSTLQTYTLDQAHNFAGDEDEGFFYNREGRGFRYLSGQYEGLNREFAVSASGELYVLLPDWQNATRLAVLPRVYHAHPELLIDVLPPARVQPATIIQEQPEYLRDETSPELENESANVRLRATVNPDELYTGRLLLRLRHADEDTIDSEVVVFDVLNTAPELGEIEDVELSWSLGEYQTEISVSDADQDPLTISAYPGDPTNLLYRLQEQYSFGESEEGEKLNDYGRGEKWFRGVYEGAEQDFFILPNGSVFAWTASIDSSFFIARLPEYYHRNLSTLWQNTGVDSAEELAVSVEGQLVRVTFPERVKAVYPVTVQVTDGVDWAEQTFFVSSVNTAPVLSFIEDQRLHWRSVPEDVVAEASDADGDALEFSVRYYDTSLAYSLDVIHDFQLKSQSFAYNSLGEEEKLLHGAEEESLYAILPDGRLYTVVESELTLNLGTLDPIYYRRPELLFDVLPPHIESPAVLNLFESTLHVEMTFGFVGKMLIEVIVTDGLLNDSQVFLIDVFDSRPVIPDESEEVECLTRVVSYTQEEFAFIISASDEDNSTDDLPLEFEALRGTSNTLAFELDQRYGFYISAEDFQLNRHGWAGKWIQGTDELVQRDFVLLPGGGFYLWNGTFDSSELLGYLPQEYYESPSLLFNAPADESFPSEVASRLSDTTFHIDPPAEWEGTVVFSPRALDGNHLDQHTCAVRFANLPPVLAPIPELRDHWSRDSFTHTLQASDPDGDSVQFGLSYFVEETAYALDQQHDFSVARGSLPFNLNGESGKYFYGTRHSEETFRYAIFPNGELFDVSGPFESRILLARLDSVYYESPHLLTDVPKPFVIAPARVSLDGSTFSINFESGYTGRFILSATASDGVNTVRQSFPVELYNNAPVIAEIEDFSMGWRESDPSFVFSAADVDADTLTSRAFADTVENRAYLLSEVHSFELRAEDFKENYYGWRGKHFQGTFEGVASEYVILPSGALYLWAGNYTESELLAYFPNEYYEQPSLFFNTSPGQTVEEIGVEIEGSRVNVILPDGFTGTVPLLLEVDDGNGFGYEVLNIEVENQAPTLETIATQSMHWRDEFLNVSLDAVDPDGDTLSYSASLQGAPNGSSVSFEGATLKVDPAANYVGVFSVLVSASDGVNTDSRSFEVQVLNRAPVLSQISDTELGWREGDFVLTLEGDDPDAADVPFLSYSASVNGNATAEVSGNTLRLSPQENFTGALAVTVSLSDGYTSVSRSFTLTVVNTAPVLESIPTQVVHWSVSKVEADLRATDEDGDELTFTAQVHSSSSASANLEVIGSRLKVYPQENFVGNLVVEVTVSDSNLSDTQLFQVVLRNSKPDLENPGTVRMGWRDDSVGLRLWGTDADPEDNLSYSARILPGYESHATMTLNGRLMTITPTEDFLGGFVIEATLTDGVASDKEYFTVYVENHAPVFEPIPQQYMSWSEESKTIRLNVTDAEDDPLTYTAKLREGTSYPAAVTLNGTEVTARLLGEQVGSFVIDATASDGLLTTSYAIVVNVGNNPPVLDLIPNQVVEQGSGTIQLRVHATDLDGDTISYTSNADDIATLAYELDQEHNFTLVQASYNQNMLGNNEKYFQGSQGGSSATHWYVIYPNGKLYLWTGRLIGSSYLATLPRAYYEDPSLLFDVGAPNASSGFADVALSGTLLSITPDPSFVGEFSVSVNANDGIAEDRVRFIVKVEGNGGGDGENPPACERTERFHAGEYSGNAFELGFVAEGRIGDTATGAGNRTFEVDVSESTAGPFNPGETANYIWENAQGTDFELRYDAESDMVLFTVDGVTTAHESSLSAAPTDILLRARAAKSDTSVVLGELVLDGEPLSGQVEASDIFGDVNVLQILGGELQDGFVLTGKATMTWGSQNLVLNGGFEQPVTSGWDVYYGEQVPGWNVAWMQGSSPCTSQDEVAGPVIEIQNNAAVNAFEGEQYAELDSHCATPNSSRIESASGSRTTTRIWQDVETVAGDRYELRFVYRRRPGSHGSQKLRVKWDGVEVIDQQEAPNSWTEVVIPVTAYDSSSRIEFADTGKGNTYGVLLDGVELRTISNVVPKNSELAFQISVGSVEGHQPCDGDGDGGNPGDLLCEGDAFSVSAPNFTVWNSFLEMTNIIELVNPSDEAVDVRVSFYSILGELAHEQVFNVPANSQNDVIVNQFPGFVQNSYGIVKLEFEGVLDGRMTYYRQSSDLSGYDFVFALPLEEASYGTTAVSFNTFQPSMKAEERENMVANWLAIINLSNTPEAFIVWTYDQNGRLLMRREIDVPAFGRADVDGGHDLAGPAVVGMHKIVPKDISVRYIAQLTRFGGNSPAGYAPSQYKFAFPLTAKHGSTEAVYAPISSRLNEFNWLEVVNIKDQEIRVGISLYSSQGRLLDSLDAVLPPNSQHHIDAASFLASGEVGYALVKPNIPKSIIAQSMFYFRDLGTGSVTSLYGSQARPLSGCSQTGSYNLFLGMENWLTVSNSSDTIEEVSVALSGGSVNSLNTFSIPARGAITLPLHDLTTFEAPTNSYGLVRVKGSSSNAEIFSEILRLSKTSNGEVDFSVPISVR